MKTIEEDRYGRNPVRKLGEKMEGKKNLGGKKAMEGGKKIISCRYIIDGTLV